LPSAESRGIKAIERGAPVNRQCAIGVLALIVGASVRASGQHASDTTRYVVIGARGEVVGAQATWGTETDRWTKYSVRQTGRVPETLEHVVLGRVGTPVRVVISGHDSMGDSVDEQFETDGREMRWSNRLEGAHRLAARAGFYISVSGPPTGLLARALLRAPAHRMSILPAGEAQIEPAGEMTVNVDGIPRTVRQYAITGLGFAPQRIWLDTSGRFIAAVTTTRSTVLGGWERSVPAFLAAQRGADAARFQRLTRTLGHRAPHGVLVFRHATVFDAVAAQLRPHTTVVVNGDRIGVVGDDSTTPVPAGATIIDASGKTLLPGLWDMHVHVAGPVDGVLHIAAGITSARDMGNDSTTLLPLKRQFDADTLIGPRLMLAGMIDGHGPEQIAFGDLVSTEADARAAVDRYASQGYEQIKVYNSVPPELVPVIVDAAHRRGLRVSGHVPAHMRADDVARAGFNEIQHVNFLIQNFIDTLTDFRLLNRLAAVGASAADIDLRSERVRGFVQLLKSRGMDIDPTLGVFEDMYTQRPGQVPPSFARVIDRLPIAVRRGLYAGGLAVPAGLEQRYRDAYQTMVHMVGELYRAGVPIVAGTDGLQGFLLHRELELYVEAGIPAPTVLQLATIGAARMMKHDAERGSIAVGKLADLILVDGDPTTDISDIRRVELTVRGGVMYRSADLYRAVGVSSPLPSRATSAR